GFGYDIYSQYYQQYHYYENLRKTNPQAYAQLYRKYYQDASGEVPYGGEDRASVHSGRSSANDELAKDRYTRQSYYSQTSLPHLGGYYRGSQTHSISGQYGLDDSSFARTLDQADNSLNYEDPHLVAQRLTPAKFATAHIKVSISSGKLVKVLPHYPLDGQAPNVELCNLESFLYNDEDYQELKRFPGPLWAMKHGLWGHALFLASKLDKRTYANVLMRFANGLTMNDPLQTLYQLLSGRTPAAVTCVADEKWGDWRPHLAMILSNSTQRPELNCKAITILGDTLMGRGSLYAAQFCYLMAEVGFSSYGSADAKLVLLGSNHNKSFLHFATNEAIHMTEIYEYARSLNDDEFALVNFQRYKYLLSTRLADVGLLEKALSYLEKIANFIVKNPGAVDRSLVNDVYLLADRLKYYDPVGDGEEDTDFDSCRLDNLWLKDLKRIQNDYNTGLITQAHTSGLASTAQLQEEHNQQTYRQNQDAWQQQYDQYQQQQWSNDQPSEPTQIEYQKQPEQQPEGYSGGQYQEPQQYWPGQQQWNPEQTTTGYHQEPVELQQNYYSSIAQTEPDEVEKRPPEVSTCNTIASPSSLKLNTSTLRKRLTSRSPVQLKSLDSVADAKTKTGFGKKTKIYPFKNRSAEDFITKCDSFDKKNSSRDSSDLEFESNLSRKKKNVFYKNEEKSQLICYKDNTKIIAIKNDSKLTKYNTFDMKFNDKKGKMVKYKSLDIPEPTAVVKYYDSQSNVAISAQDFNSDFKLTKFDRKKHKHDIITDTVDAWAKKSSSNVFSNIKNSIFKSNKQTKEVIYKPLVFGGTFPIDDIPPPQISLPNQQPEGKGRADDVMQNDQPKKEPAPKPKPEPAQNKPAGNGWFGGIFSKLTFKPNNQMKLPDDKNPTILWDPEKKRWVNTDEDNGDGVNDFKPPPKMSEIMPKIQPAAMPQPTFAPVPQAPRPEQAQQESNGGVPKSTQPNMFKLQRGRNLKKSYIDVFNPNAKSSSSLPAPASLGGMQPLPAQMNFFVPQPVNDPNAPTDFLTPAPPLQYEDNSQVQ
ncbi:uncharacterized protein BDFB_009106, partial [Asbolus verrucosus]